MSGDDWPPFHFDPKHPPFSHPGLLEECPICRPGQLQLGDSRPLTGPVANETTAGDHSDAGDGRTALRGEHWVPVPRASIYEVSNTGRIRSIDRAEHLFDNVHDAKELINMAVGAGSVCWENPGGAGIFDSTTAAAVADAAFNRLQVILAGLLAFGEVSGDSGEHQ